MLVTWHPGSTAFFEANTSLSLRAAGDERAAPPARQSGSKV